LKDCRLLQPYNSQIGALFAMKDTLWDHALEVTGDGSGLVGHAGGILLQSSPTGVA